MASEPTIQSNAPAAPSGGLGSAPALFEWVEQTRQTASIASAVALATSHLESGRRAEAESVCLKILEHDPAQADALHISGVLAHLAGKNGFALALLEKAARSAPLAPQIQYNWGVVLAATGAIESAAQRYRMALALSPGHSNALRNLGNFAFEAGHYREAVRCFEGALVEREGHAHLHLSLALALCALREIERARSPFERALALAPDDARILWEAAQYFLLLGDFPRGWDLYEARFAAGDDCRVWQYAYPYPPWQGESLRGRHLLVHGEQGLGDEIMFFSILPELLEQGARITLVGQPQLTRLWSDVFPGCSVRVQPRVGNARWTHEAPPWLAELNADPPHFQIPLASLGRLTRRTQDDFARQKPYILPDPQRRIDWLLWLRQRPADPRDALPPGSTAAVPLWEVSAQPKKLRVGLVWAGASGLDHPAARRKDAQRSLALEQFRPLFANRSVQWISLQVGPAAAQIGLGEAALPILDCAERLVDFKETAALVANLDLVIAVDTAVAHLAGAIGKPVWILLPFAAEWRWGLDAKSTLWWPSAVLFRQPRPGDWVSVIRAVEGALAGLCPA